MLTIATCGFCLANATLTHELSGAAPTYTSNRNTLKNVTSVRNSDDFSLLTANTDELEEVNAELVMILAELQDADIGEIINRYEDNYQALDMMIPQMKAIDKFIKNVTSDDRAMLRFKSAFRDFFNAILDLHLIVSQCFVVPENIESQTSHIDTELFANFTFH